MSTVTLSRPWLMFDLGRPMPVLSWAINRPGFVTAERILWREVRNADLSVDLDVQGWLSEQLADRSEEESVAFLTSRDVRHFTEEKVTIGNARAHAVATVGLSNAERVGLRVDRSGQSWGTINVALRLDRPMTQAAMLEAMSVAVQARTTAVLDVQLPLPHGPATGTGTDCVAVAAPGGDTGYAGLHTEIGEAAGRAVYQAVHKGATRWMAQQWERKDVGS